MASQTTVQLKRSSVAGKKPDAANVDVGEPVVNLADKIIFTKDGTGNVIVIGAGTTSNVTEGNNLYFTDGRVATALTKQTLSNASFSSTVYVGGELSLGPVGGDEGAQINFGQAVTNSTLAGDTVTLDIYQNKLRIFEQGGNARGAYIDISACADGVGTNLIGSGTGTITSVAGVTSGSVSNAQLATATVTSQTLTNATFSANVTADKFISSNNGNGENYRVGDDAWIGDINLANSIRIKGNQDAANAYINFGTGDTASLGRAGTGPLTYTGAFTATGNVSTGNVSGTAGTFTYSRLGTVESGTWQGSSISTTYTDAKITSVAGQTGAISNTQLASAVNQTGILTTANVSEVTNLYFTNARSYANVTQLGYITSSSLNGYATNNQLSIYALDADLTTANVTELTNLYYTNARVYANVTPLLAAKADLTGATFTGNVIATNLLPPSDDSGTVGDANRTWNNGHFTNLSVDTLGSISGTLNVRTALDLGDNDILRFGDTDDFEIYHDGTNTYLDLNSGNLIFRDTVSDRATFVRHTGDLVLSTGNVQANYFVGNGSALTNVRVSNSNISGNIISSQIEPTAVTSGTYGNSSIVPVYTVDKQGRLTNASNVSISIPSSALNTDVALGTQTSGAYVANLVAGSGISLSGLGNEGTTPTIALSTSGVTNATYGNATFIPSIVIDTFGRITSASNVTVNVANSNVQGNTIASKLEPTGVTAGVYGAAAVQPVITIDQQGRITSASNVTSTVANTNITGNIISSQITSVANSQITGNIISSQLQPSGVTAATYGGATNIPAIVIDQQGRITSASNVAVSASGGGRDGTFNTGINRNIGYNLTTTSSAAFIAPSTAGTEYIVHSIHVTNINTTAAAEVTGSFDGTTYSGNITFATTVPVPIGTSVELLKKPKVLQPNDKIQLNANVASALNAVITYEQVTSTAYFGAGVDVTTAGAFSTLYTATANSVVESILLSNDDGTLDVRARVAWTDAFNNIQGYYAYDLIIPADATVEVLEQPKYLESNHKIRVYANQANRLEAIISGKSQ